MLRLRFHIIGWFFVLSSSLLTACNSALLCGEYACVWYQDECEKTYSCSEPRQRRCEAAGSIRDRAPRIINQLRDAHRSCGGSSSLALINVQNNQLIWDETLARISNSHARDMADNRFESFVGTNGLSTSERVSIAGINSLTVFESVNSGPQTAAETINSWLDIPTDCQQLIHPDITRVGMACAIDELDNSGPYWSLLLAGPEP